MTAHETHGAVIFVTGTKKPLIIIMYLHRADKQKLQYCPRNMAQNLGSLLCREIFTYPPSAQQCLTVF